MSLRAQAVNAADIILSEQDLALVRALIYKHTGMMFQENKNYYFESKVRQRMVADGHSSFRDYHHELIFGNPELHLKSLIEAITINETYFFRDFPQLQGFAENILTRYSEQKAAKKDLRLRVWSAACSTGEEPYTLSIILQEIVANSQAWDLSVDATDIDTTVMRFAQEGAYGERSMKDTPLPYRQKYFKQLGDSWLIQPQASKLVNFRQLNFTDRTEMRKMKGYDFIFCRNVLIYFDDESRKKVVAHLYDSLVPGGYLFLGHSESVGRITAAFTLERVGDFLCYRKPL